MEKWLTVKQVSENLGVHEDTVRIWLRTGQLKGRLLSRRAGWRIAAADLDAFMREDPQTAKTAA